MNFLKEFFSYPFVIRALISGVLISLSASLLGVNLVLKRFSMLGDGLSHVSFGTAAIALALGVAPLKLSIPIVIIAAVLLLRLNKSSKMKGDAAIAVVSSGALAIGIAVATVTTGFNTDISNYMFGSILSISKGDLCISIAVSLAVILLCILFYNKLFLVCFDEDFARACGTRADFYNLLSAVLTAVIVVIGMRMMGALLISSIITVPALSAMRICKRYKNTIILASVISVTAFVLGLVISFFYDIPAGASVVIINLSFFIVTSVLAKIKSR